MWTTVLLSAGTPAPVPAPAADSLVLTYKLLIMQNMFANLALTNQDHYIPRPFWNAFKDYNGQRLNVREHQDAYEFFTRLQVPI